MLKTKDGGDSIGGGYWMLKRKKEASASEGAEIPKGTGKTEATLSEASEILKLKKEAFGATRLWREMGIPGALERWVKAREEEEAKQAEEARQPKKRKMVVKTKLPKTVIDVMKLQPCHCIDDMSDEELANQTDSFRELYALVKFVDDKMNAYEQALINQYDSKGYAKDDTEVADDRQAD
ncbi:uncharacterized protein [Miscanthus floridulus]|uniref:uncharacterized protein n=1 Tax=Miscanthus floridulus TaxID=154761 RepID=UPI0034586F85